MSLTMTSAVHLDRVGKCGDVVPCAEPGIDLGVVGGVEAGVRPVDGDVERQQVHATEQPVQRTLQQGGQPTYRAGQTVRVRDELDVVAHGFTQRSTSRGMELRDICADKVVRTGLGRTSVAGFRSMAYVGDGS